KPFTILDPINSSHYTSCSSYEKPASKSAVKMIDSERIDDLISLLHTEAKVL
ncbi:MAG: electron transfer flavoprotein subunit alpha, partial [Flavobacteriales bacterium]|nr:electron transfer flavoprotein subunit alpha [Flavobacteriales bacterium]